jgi:hypothetical protein
MHAQQTNDNTWWSVAFILELPAAENSYWKLITKGEEVWAYDSRRLVQVW